MTGGMVIVLGQTGRNFAAGMSGGVAFVLDEDGNFEKRCNLSMVALEPVPEELAALDSNEEVPESHGRVHFNHLNQADEHALREQIEKHLMYTGSERARLILENWNSYLPKFTKVMPTEYRRALQDIAAQKAQELEVA
jgi:glutamate synthase (NADPH/NADH) large chain